MKKKLSVKQLMLFRGKNTCLYIIHLRENKSLLISIHRWYWRINGFVCWGKCNDDIWAIWYRCKPFGGKITSSS